MLENTGSIQIQIYNFAFGSLLEEREKDNFVQFFGPTVCVCAVTIYQRKYFTFSLDAIR